MYWLEYNYQGKWNITVFKDYEDREMAIACAELMNKWGQEPWLHTGFREWNFKEKFFEHAGL